MWLIRAALRRPITALVVVLGIALGSILTIFRMPVDIFPNLNLPVIYVAQPFGGMDPGQMEGYLTYYYEYHFLYIAGIESVESRSIQNVALIKLTFHPGTDMSQALAQTISYVDRSRAFMPFGTVPPFVMRFDAGSVPVGYLVFSSETRGVKEVQDLALNRVRPLFATLPGVSAPPPFGGTARTIVIRVDPERLRAYNFSPDDVVKAVSAANTVLPAGNVGTGDLMRMAPINSVVANIGDLLFVPIRPGPGPTVFVRDIGTVEDASDILPGFALVNGRRTVYIPVTKRADASTLAVVNAVRAALPRFRAIVPEDIAIGFEFDQSGFVRAALASLIREGLLGAVLTGLMVLLFLGDWRSASIVVITIPFALLAALVALWTTGQTINIMTLGGLALAVGILVDEATVAIENIHRHLAQGARRARAVLDASREVVVPRLLAMLCVLAVFVPSFLMTGVTRSLFVPLSLAVGFAMAASFFLSSSLVPILSIWLLREHRAPARRSTMFERFQEAYGAGLARLLRLRWAVVAAYVVATFALIVLAGPRLGTELFPGVKAEQLRLRFRAPIGTRVEVTEQMAHSILEAIRQTAGPDNVGLTLGYVGIQPPPYPINTIFLWTSGPHEGVLLAQLRPGLSMPLADLQERLRKRLATAFPHGEFSFEPGDLVSQIMNFGSPTPVDVDVKGPRLAASRAFAERLRAELARIDSLRDLQYAQPLDYPSIDVEIDRQMAGQLGVTVAQAAKSFVAATSSSRYIAPNYWRDPTSGIAYQVQVEVPQSKVTSIEDIQNVPIMADGGSDRGRAHPLIGDVARVQYGTIVGEYDRENGQRMVSLTANVRGEDLGRVARRVDAAIQEAGAPPRGVTVTVRGQITPMRATLANLRVGLALAVAVIFLLLAAYFQSLRLALVVISTIPAVICGAILALLATGTTLNLQSFMGAIMAIGVAVANAILLVTFAEERRRAGQAAGAAAVEGARTRLRPVLMTTFAMVAGMLPLALALGQGADASAPLGRAVIGGLVAATASTLAILPSVFAIVQGRASVQAASLDPDDPESQFADGGAAASPAGAATGE
jgi:multidrug efflux pump subunit AcrB